MSGGSNLLSVSRPITGSVYRTMKSIFLTSSNNRSSLSRVAPQRVAEFDISNSKECTGALSKRFFCA